MGYSPVVASLTPRLPLSFQRFRLLFRLHPFLTGVAQDRWSCHRLRSSETSIDDYRTVFLSPIDCVGLSCVQAENCLG